MLIENKKPIVVSIGEWIDSYLDSKKYNVVKYGQENANMELLDISKEGIEAFTMSCDDTGKVNWHHITNITRHDPSEFIYKIRTKWGRTVSVVASKSLLIWNEQNNIFEEKDSENVKIGDMVPVTFQAPTKFIINFVNVRDYLPVDEYIYTSDYSKSIKNFETKEGYVYLKNAKRNSPCMPERFALNRENGFFIGLFLAEGNTCVDYVGIANNDDDIRNKVAKWFEDNNIKHRTQVKAFNPKRPGLSTSIRGYSKILVQFLEKFLGKYSNGKYVPHEAYIADDEFVKGLIDGYFSGDGCVTEYHIVSSSVSRDLSYGISNLLSRYGIFAKISKIQQKENNVGSKNILPRYNLSIQSSYVYRFAEVFSFSLKKKQEKLQHLVSKKTLGSMSFLYQERNDVVLDKIVSIEKVDSQSDDMYKKVYDITVPDTLNFQIFNGLGVRDTSETGYLQRKLVKAMEDCKISYDHTVRNASGTIVQFLYGEDGMDPTKVESQGLPYIEMDYSQLRDKYLITEADVENELSAVLLPPALEALKTSKDWQDKMKAHFDEVLNDREFIIKDIFKGKLETSIMYPVSFQRIITNAQSMFKNAGITDLNPLYVLIELNKLCDSIYITKWNRGNKFFQILARAFLSPKRVVMEYKFDRNTFDYVLQQIKHRFYDAIAHPSEMVGVISAQSIGEP